MARTTREIYPDEDPVRDLAPLDLSKQGMANRPAEIIETIERMPEADYADELKFNEDILTVMLEGPAQADAMPDRGESPPTAYDFSVGNDTRVVPIGVPVKIERKFVEVIGRARTGQVSLQSAIANDPRSRNVLRRTHTKRFPLTMIENPGGAKAQLWWQRISRES